MTIYQIDAFTDELFHGNPAAVIPLNEWPDASVMQNIAIEKNLSETAFIVKTAEGYHIRWFTPGFEIDLCGHATLASAFVIKNYLDPSVETINFSTQQAGTLRTLCSGDKYTLDFPARMPQPCHAPPTLFKSLGINGAVEVMRSRDYVVVLSSEEAVKNIQPDFALIKELDAVGVIVTAKGTSADIVSRCFYPGAGIPEDPVTGSAHCNIVPYWCEKLGTNKLLAKQLSERGGTLWCELLNDRVLMSGYCVPFMKGELLI